MTHLRIEQNTTGIEEVSSAVIKKLYDLVYSGTLDNTSNLLGRLHTTATHQSYIDYLTGLYPNLYITANKYYMSFADPLVELILLQYDCGDGTGITLNDVAGYRIGTGELFYRQPITSFDEFLYFTSPSFTYTASLFCLECSQLTSITYPPLMQIISGNSHLENTSLTSIDLRNTSLTTISNGAFYGCTALTTVNIPDTCTTLGNGAFENCTNLSSIDLSHITTFGNGVLRNCTNLTTANLYNATSIGTECFMNSGLTSVDFTGSTITNIPTSTFNGCTNLSSVTFPSGLTTIGNAAFLNCTSLTSIQLPNTVEYLLGNEDNGAFRSCTSLTSVSGLENIRRFNGRVFSGCTNLGVNLDLVLNIRESLANNANLYYTFNLTGYKSVTLHSTVPLSVCEGAFQSMPNLKVLDFSDTVNTKVFEPGYYSKVETVILPATITLKINWRFRSDNYYLSKIIILATTPPLLENTQYWYINGRGSNPYYSPCYIYVPDEALNDYLTADVWSGIADHIRPLSHSDLDNVTWYTKEHPLT